MKIYVGVTDYDWFRSLRDANCEEVNFWKPSGKANFKVLNKGDLFLFKLHSPNNYIVGGGYFVTFSILPLSLAWEAFGTANGAASYLDLVNRVHMYRRTDRLTDPDPQVGCIILAMSFYLKEVDWIPVTQDWNRNIVQGKSYDTSEYHGQLLYEKIQAALGLTDFIKYSQDGTGNRYGKEQIVKPRIGQGAFRILTTDAYQRRCAITGEKTLPVLEAAHIKPYNLEGPHDVSNGLLLRRDFHTLFDRGYITIDKNMKVEVSHRIKEDFGNGKEYYAHHGQSLLILPKPINQIPDLGYLQWHNEHVYLG
ncbi:MAG: HNH endonuclease [Christensenellales bacterium]